MCMCICMYEMKCVECTLNKILLAVEKSFKRINIMLLRNQQPMRSCKKLYFVISAILDIVHNSGIG